MKDYNLKYIRKTKLELDDNKKIISTQEIHFNKDKEHVSNHIVKRTKKSIKKELTDRLKNIYNTKKGKR